MCDEEGVLALMMMKMMMAMMMLKVTMRMMMKMGMRVGMMRRLSEICANAAGSTVERTGLRMIFPGKPHHDPLHVDDDKGNDDGDDGQLWW